MTAKNTVIKPSDLKRFPQLTDKDSLPTFVAKEDLFKACMKNNWGIFFEEGVSVKGKVATVRMHRKGSEPIVLIVKVLDEVVTDFMAAQQDHFFDEVTRLAEFYKPGWRAGRINLSMKARLKLLKKATAS